MILLTALHLGDASIPDGFGALKINAVFLEVGFVLVSIPFAFHTRNIQNVYTNINPKNEWYAMSSAKTDGISYAFRLTVTSHLPGDLGRIPFSAEIDFGSMVAETGEPTSSLPK